LLHEEKAINLFLSMKIQKEINYLDNLIDIIEIYTGYSKTFDLCACARVFLF